MADMLKLLLIVPAFYQNKTFYVLIYLI